MGWFSKATGGLFDGGSSNSSSNTNTSTAYTDNSTETVSSAQFDSLYSSGTTYLGTGASYTYNEGGLTGENLKQVTNTLKTINSDNLTAVKKLNSDALSLTKTLNADNLSATKQLGNKAFATAENLYNKSENTLTNLYNKTQNTLSDVFDKTVSAVQSSASKAIDTTAQAYAESDDEFRRAVDGLRPIAMYIMLAAITFFIFRNKRW